MRLTPAEGIAFILLPLVLLVGCSAGGGDLPSSGGTSGLTTSSTTSFSAGAISGFGSVIVNGAHWSDDATVDISVDDQRVTKDALRVGMVVEIEGAANSDGTGKAARMTVQNLVVGPVEVVDVVAGTLLVLGQTVKVSGATVFDNVNGLAGIARADVVAVSGWFDNFNPTQRNNIIARRIERRAFPAGSLLKVTGFVENLNSPARIFNVNGLAVDFGSAQFPNASAAALKNGLLVDVRSHALPVPLGSTFAAGSVALSQVRRTPAQSAQVQVQGVVTDLDPIALTFTVDGIAVDAHMIGVAGLANGMNVELSGLFSNGVLLLSSAANVVREFDAHVKIEAPIQGISVTGATVTVLGKQILVRSTTQFIDNGSGLRTFALRDIQANDPVRVRAFEDTNRNLVAVKIIRLPATLNQIVLQGRMDTKDATTTSLTLQGIRVQGGPNTQWQIGDTIVTAGTWFTSAELNTIVKATGASGFDGRSLDVGTGKVETREDQD